MLQNTYLPVCGGGLNMRDPLNQMAPGDAIIYDNLLHNNGADEVRPGYAKFADVADVLIPYEKKDASRVLAIKGNILKAYSTAGEEKFTYTFGDGSSNQQAETFIDGAGNVHKFITDGGTQVYDFQVGDSGDEMTIATFTDANNLSFPFSYKNRIYFIEPYTTNIWYGGSQAISGELKKFFVGPFFKRGGYLIALGTWTQDGGDGMDDQLVLFSNRGEVLIYSGLSPEDDTWRLVGRYEFPAPLNAKCVAQIKGDLAIVTKVGCVPLSSVLAELNANKVAISNKINGAFVDKNPDAIGWQIQYWQDKGWIVINAPSAESGLQYENYVFNLNSNTWSRFLGHEMHDMCIVDGRMFFCNRTGTFEISGTTDNGKPIKWRMHTAYSDFGVKQRKKVMRANIHLSAATVDGLYKYIWTDFIESARTFVYDDAADTEDLSQWNISNWNEAKWAQIIQMHNIKAGIAHNAAVYISIGFWGASTVATQLLGADVMLIVGKGVV